MRKPRIIAFYLPQYHPFPENDMWWGKGFTEWTNVGKASPLFKGHQQPKVPADLGYYDLRIPEVRAMQADYARRAGVEGFCYYHYWFGGKELMDMPLNEIVRSGSPDYPFCICWANESWHNKFWRNDLKGKDTLLIEQVYPGEEDNERHFYRLLNAFRDPRYITEDGRLLFVIYNALGFPSVRQFIDQWQRLAIDNGLPGFYFVGYTTLRSGIKTILECGFDAVNYNRLPDCLPRKGTLGYYYNVFLQRAFKRPIVIPYKKAIQSFDGDEDEREDIIPSLIPNWDHTPRSGYKGYLMSGSSPALFREHIRRVFDRIKGKSDQLVFLKSWNEWGEGNYMEPDLRFGCQYIDALSEEISHFSEIINQ